MSPSRSTVPPALVHNLKLGALASPAAALPLGTHALILISLNMIKLITDNNGNTYNISHALSPPHPRNISLIENIILIMCSVGWTARMHYLGATN